MKRSISFLVFTLFLGILQMMGANVTNNPKHLVFGKKWMEAIGFADEAADEAEETIGDAVEDAAEAVGDAVEGAAEEVADAVKEVVE